MAQKSRRMTENVCCKGHYWVPQGTKVPLESQDYVLLFINVERN